MIWTPSLSLYVCIGKKYSVSKLGLVLSAHIYVMVFQDKHILTKWNTLSNCLLVYSRERIFHFGRVCWSWKTTTYIQVERTRPWTQNISGQYRHTYEQRESHSYSKASNFMLVAKRKKFWPSPHCQYRIRRCKWEKEMQVLQISDGISNLLSGS